MKVYERIYPQLQPHIPSRVLYDPHFPIIFFHSPKAGCTTLVRWFFFQLGLLEEAQTKYAHVHDYRVKQFNKNPIFLIRAGNAILTNQKPVMKLVRNPYSRAVSSFLHFSKVILLFQLNNAQMQSNWKQAKKQFPQYVGISFKQFLLFLKKELAEGSPLDPHINGQYVEGEEQLVSRFVKLEHLESYIKEWETQYELKRSPFKELANSAHHNSKRMTVKGNFADHVFTHQDLMQGFPTISSFYDPVTIALVSEIFKKEFEMYGYSKQFLV